MATWKPDPSFYPSPRMAMKAPPETLAYVAAFDPTATTPDALAVVDVDPKSGGYGTHRRAFLYVACWGTGDFHQYDVSDPFKPKLTGNVRIGGIVSRATHPAAKNGALNGGPQMVEVSRDGRRVYFTNSLYGAIDEQFYPEGVKGWMVKLDARPEGGMAFDEKFFVEWPKSHRPHQVRLEGGDCSSDSYCYP